jgi:hypothetical protein
MYVCANVYSKSNMEPDPHALGKERERKKNLLGNLGFYSYPIHKVKDRMHIALHYHSLLFYFTLFYFKKKLR